MEAKRVDIEKAKKVARSYARSTSHISMRRDFQLSKTVTKRVTRQHPAVRSIDVQQQDEPMFYVFTTNGNGGFIIISGDDVAKPVLGYSGNGNYDESNPNLAYWMEMLSQEIAYAIENGLSQDEQTKAAWQAFENENPVQSQSSGDYVYPLIKTQWDQESPYNNLCPVISGRRTLSGCGATAMAQIMKYHEHPTTRTVEIPGYTTSSKAIKIDPITGSTSYDWKNMTDTYSFSSTSVENETVATLMYHCGVSIKMDYDLESSFSYLSDIVVALKNYFDYDDGISFLWKSYYSNSEWLNLLKTEISAGRPVCYRGEGSEGHIFVCDGYDIHNLFHFNWGWGGYSDGYYELSALNPANTAGYNQDQIIMTGIQPKGAQPNIQLELSSIYANKTSLNSLSESFNITADALKNTGSTDIMNVNLGVLLYTQDDSCITHRTSPQQMNLHPFYSFTTYTLLSDYSLPSDLPAGIYRLYPAYSVASETPHIIPGANGDRYILVVVNNDGSVTLHRNDRMPDLSLVSLKAIGDLYRNKTGNFEVEINNRGTVDYNSNLSLKIDSHTITNPVVIPAETTKTIRFSGTIPLSPGNCSLSVWYDLNNLPDNNLFRQLGNNMSAQIKAEPAVQMPDITIQPQSAISVFGEAATALSVTANVTDGGTLSYQWYSNTIDDNTGGEKINGATSTSYTPSTAAIGTTYYYALVVNTNIVENIAGLQTATATSHTAAITVNKASQPAPVAPTLAGKTATSVTLNTISSDVEYSMDGENWQSSTVFDNLAPNTIYTFYARMKETDTHNASPASAELQVSTYADVDAKLLSLTVNGKPVQVAGTKLDYQAECNETQVMLDMEASVAASVTVTVNDIEYSNQIPLSGELTVININIVSEDKTNDYILTVSNPVDASLVLFQRWEDVIAVNSNPDNNGKYNIDGVRWYINGSMEALSSWFIQITEGETYRAEIYIAYAWHHVCGSPKKYSETVAAYPNPVSTGDNLTLQLPDSFAGGYMDVINLAGSVVKHKLPLPDSVNTISLADLTPGIYLLNIIAPNGDRELMKIIVSN
jgi:hypothetical protein